MTIHSASDRSLLISFEEKISAANQRRVARLSARLKGARGILNLHPAYASVLVDFDPRLRRHEDLEELVRRWAETEDREPAVEQASWPATAASSPPGHGPKGAPVAGREAGSTNEPAVDSPGRVVEIPVIYGRESGPDLDDVARHAGISPERVIQLHSSADYLVYFLGFSPGFPYLGGLPPELATPRLSAPRKRTPAGSVAIGGSQAGVYPVDSPGGWRIIGRTPLRLFDPDASPPALLAMGDTVRFVPVAGSAGSDLEAAGGFNPTAGKTGGATSLAEAPVNRIRVVAPGFQTTVQDLGRFGYAHLGVSACGAADALALRAGNLLVGNAENAAALEMTLVGGEFQFDREAVVALTGSDFGADIPMWSAVTVAAGQSVRCGATRSGARCCLAVRGGIAVPKTLGSASAHVLTGVGGGPLRKGDELPIGDAVVSRPRLAARAPEFESKAVLRVTAGPQAGRFAGELYRAAYEVTEESNRMGLRLRGPAIPSPPGHMLTEGAPLGAVQIPPGGQPIVLFVEHQTTGGYPKPANVISADFWKLGQLRPRDEIRFELVTLDCALDLLRQQEQWLYGLSFQRPA